MSNLGWFLHTESEEYQQMGESLSSDINEAMRLATCGYDDAPMAIEALDAIGDLLRDCYERDTIRRMTDVICAAVPVVNLRLFYSDPKGHQARAQSLNLHALGERLCELAACGR